LEHMRLLAPTIRRHSDVIFALQAGFIGRWGEWHNTQHGNDAPRRHNAFLDEFRRLFGGVTNLEVRHPEFILDYAEHLRGTPDESGVLGLGLGLHDDEFASTPNDGGTFEPKNTRYSGCMLRRTAARIAARYTMTGESSKPYSAAFKPDCPGDVPEPDTYNEFAQAYSLTTLQLGFGVPVMKQWAATGSYADKVRRIGPHLRLTTAQLRADGHQGQLSLRLKLKNSGWARVANARPLFLVLRSGGREVLKRRLALDLTAVLAGGELERTEEVAADLLPGRYEAFLLAPDPAARLADRADYALLFENEGVRRVEDGLNALGVFEIAR
jgi:hypothetical protein